MGVSGDARLVVRWGEEYEVLRPWRVGTGVLVGFGFLASMLVGVGLRGLPGFSVARSVPLAPVALKIGVPGRLHWTIPAIVDRVIVAARGRR